jgi:hypothetical protein
MARSSLTGSDAKTAHPNTEACEHNPSHQPHSRSGWSVQNRAVAVTSLGTSIELPITLSPAYHVAQQAV